MGSRVFDGIDDYLEVASAVVAVPPFTFACWFKPFTTNANHTLVGISNNAAAAQYHNLRASGGVTTPIDDPLQAISRNTTTNLSESLSSFQLNTWQFGAGVWASSSSRIAYLGDVAGIESTTLRDVPSQNTTAIGRLSRPSPADFLNGKIAVVAIWNVALNQTQISALAAGALPTAIPTGLVAYWPMMSGLSPEPDVVGGFDMTVNGTTFDAADTPPVGETPMPSTDANFVDVTGAVTNIFTAAVANTVVTVRVSAPVLLAGDDGLGRFPLRPEDGALQLTLGIGTDLMAGATPQPGQPTEARVFIFVTEP